MATYWVKRIKYKKGTLHYQLGVPKNRKLPVSLLKKIMNARVKEKIIYNKKRILITPLLKKRVNLAINLRKINKKGRIQ